jgi:hypothetical protein
MDFRWLPSFRLGAIPEQLELLETSFESRSGSFSTSVPKREFGNQPNDGGMPDQSVAGRLAPNRGVGRESLPNRKRSSGERPNDPSNRKRCLQSQTIGSGAPNRSFQERRSHPSNRKRAFNRPLPIANGRFNRDPSRRDLSAKDCRPTTRYTGQGARKKSGPAVPFLDSPAFMLRIRKVVQRKSYSRGSLQSSAT